MSDARDKFVTPMPLPAAYEREILTILMEECAEVQQRASKLIRFGRDEVQPGQPSTNAQRLGYEVGDLLALVDMCIDAGLLGDTDLVAARTKKRAKVAKYLQSEATDAAPELARLPRSGDGASGEGWRLFADLIEAAASNPASPSPAPMAEETPDDRDVAFVLSTINAVEQSGMHWTGAFLKDDLARVKEIVRAFFRRAIEGEANDQVSRDFLAVSDRRLQEAQAALTAAQKRQDEARKALQPFANIARLYAEKEAQERQHQRDAGLSEDAVVKPDHHRVSIALGDCRKALASLQGSGA